MKLRQSKSIDMGHVKSIRLAPNPDSRGALTEIFRQEWLDGPAPVPLATLRQHAELALLPRLAAPGT